MLDLTIQNMLKIEHLVKHKMCEPFVINIVQINILIKHRCYRVRMTELQYVTDACDSSKSGQRNGTPEFS